MKTDSIKRRGGVASKPLKELTKKMLMAGLHHPNSTMRIVWSVLQDQERRMNKMERQIRLNKKGGKWMI